MMQSCDTRPGVTATAPGAKRDSQYHVTGEAAIPTSRHTCTCVFPAGQIAVVHVSGAQSAEQARVAVQAAWHPCQYEVEDGDQSGGHAKPFFLHLEGEFPKRNVSLLRNAEGVLQ